METQYDFDETDSPILTSRIVYVKPVAVTELPSDVQAQAEGADQVFAVHGENGERLALVRNRNLAFLLARQNDMAPVHVH